MSIYEYVTINANFYYLMDEKFRCEQKVRDFSKRTNYEQARHMINEANGCNKYEVEAKYTVENIEYHSCFCNYKHADMNYFFSLSDAMGKGVMPFDGTLNRQPNKIMEIVSLIDGLKIEYESEMMKKVSK